MGPTIINMLHVLWLTLILSFDENALRLRLHIHLGASWCDADVG